MKPIFYSFILALALSGAATGNAAAQARKPAPGKAPVKGKPGVKAPLPPPPPVEAARRVLEEEPKPQLIINKVKIKDPVLVFYQQAAPGTAVQQLLMEEKNLPLLKTTTLEDLVARREVFVDGLGNYSPPGQNTADADKYRLTGVSLLASSEKRYPAPDGRSTYARLKVPSPGELYVVRESAEEYRHFVSGPQKKGSRIDFETNGLPGVDSIRAVYTLRKIDVSERGAGSGEVIR
ncbi:MAG: hypothetical protein EOO56_01415 [Hymenobacter sp.]|nr:MAG: hypothetical protein EOO56_01415 [Hymenobacter sp.]